MAKRRLADEYDAAQERGEVSGHGGDRKIKVPDANLENIGLTKRDVHEAREIRDAEEADPGTDDQRKHIGGYCFLAHSGMGRPT